MSEDEVRDLVDKQAIRDVVLRYCRGVDRRDGNLVRGCFHADAVSHYGGFDGETNALVDWLLAAVAPFSLTQHVVGNHHSELHGDLADSDTSGVAYNIGEPGGAGSGVISGFRHVDRLQRRDGEWRIAERRAVLEFTGDASGLRRPG